MSKTLLAQAQKHLSSSNDNLDYKGFLKAFFAKVPADDMDGMSPQSMAYTAQNHLELAHNRAFGKKPAISIYTPTPAKQGWKGECTAIDIVNDDMAFLVDSVVAEIIHQQHSISTFLHPVLHVEHQAPSQGKNKIKNIHSSAKNDKTTAQSHIHIELDRVISPAQIKDLKSGIEKVLLDTRYANRDWPAMRKRLKEAGTSLQSAQKKVSKNILGEYQEFINYLHDDNFTLLGYREYNFLKSGKKMTSRIVKGSSLGLLSDEVTPVYINEARKSLTESQQELRLKQEPITISKVNKRSTVHRRVPLDAIAIKEYDARGNVKKERLFIGLFTSVTYSRSVTDIPYLRMKVENAVKKARFSYASHNYKALRHILEKYPRDEILQMPEKLLYEHGTDILRLQERPQIALFTRIDPFGRYISCLVYIPREKFETKLRLKIQHILEQELGGVCNNHKVLQDDSPLARVLYQIDINTRRSVPKFDKGELEHTLIEAGQIWSDKLAAALQHKIKDTTQASNLISRYKDAFPTSYQERYHAQQAVLDIQKISNVIAGEVIDLELYEEKRDDDKQEIHLKLYHADTPLTLSDVLPIMENMGLNVITELPAEIRPANYDGKVWIHDFLLEPHNLNVKIDIQKTKKSFEDVFKKTWKLEVENDSLNMLSFYARMPWHDIAILRTYLHYYRQTGSAFSLPYMESAITTYPDIGEKIVTLFKDLFDPEGNKISNNTKQKRITKIHHALDKVSALDHDRILRSITNLVGATLRTNFFQRDENGDFKTYLSIKLDSKKIEELPEPKPYREIFVYSARTEGVHLRGDKIARGGLRWSDRHEDFRTEILGLMKAQQVKNAIIVPMGAKGGFVVKNPSKEGGRAAFMEEGISCYKTFIRGLLDITDNRKGKNIIPPGDVVRYDEDDPYLVVAADKGTASFSDIANSLSEEYGFWLNDAFASGGSAGYDHKKMGITARGAWESVKRHFRELNHDTQTQDFDVIGVGDMGGDVFGNGMLLSEHICLVGAFNHLHIFCDPNPDLAKSFKERKRLFDAVKGWDAYNTKLLSKGGRIYSRSDKSLKLTPEIKKRFDIEEDNVSPSKLIRAMLLARTDLMWFGGIGTYIKASDESHIEVGDKGNDILRIDAKDLKAKVLGEGANLAITQQARIEYANNGGRLNADYIDNAGGVASSDDEVNIKILLGDVMRKSKHDMDLKKRNKLLESMTDSVAAHVLRGCYQQSQGISLMELKSAKNIGAHGRLIKYLEQKIDLNRELEELPAQEVIKERRRMGKGLTRPELSVLQSYAKISYTQDLLASDIPENKAMEERLFRYFPPKLQKKYPKEIRDHRLSREIIATTLAGGIVNRMGPDFILEIMNKCGASCEDVAKAYIIVREAFGLRDLWNKIEDLDGKVPANVQLQALHETARMMERAVTWFLTRYGRRLDINRDIAHFEEGILSVKDHLDQVVPKELLGTIKQLTQNGIDNGLPKNLSRHISLMPVLGSACDIIRISVDHKFEIPITARVYFELGDHFHLDWMRQKARHMPSDTHWGAQALEGMVDQLYTCQAGLTIQILKDMGQDINQGPPKGKNDIGCIGCESATQAWINDRGAQAKLLEPLFEELRRSGSLDLSMLTIVEQRLRNLYGG
ncbi:MAG: NAD-glutamate dehydrogenase [Alphaproteobacteria bacterium]|nr:NAD-glutamate dehydrogenase [Alphaproteobacteria bacterium]